MISHEKIKKEALKKEEVKKEYDALEPEFKLLKELLKARKEAGLTQADIAKKIGIKTPAVARFEKSLLTGKHSPSLSTLKKYINALGYKLEIKLIPKNT